jgi:hypothetical protein
MKRNYAVYCPVAMAAECPYDHAYTVEILRLNDSRCHWIIQLT